MRLDVLCAVLCLPVLCLVRDRECVQGKQNARREMRKKVPRMPAQMPCL